MLPTETNNGIAALGSILAILITGWTAYLGYKNKGKDADHSRENQSYDNLQEDNVNLRAERDNQRARGDQYQRLLDESEEARLSDRRKFREEMARDQELRHDMKGLIRGLLFRIEDHNRNPDNCLCQIKVDDLAERAKLIDRVPPPRNEL